MQRAGAAMIGELRRKPGMGHLGLGGDHDAGGVLVEPVDDAGPLDPADALEAGAAVKEQGVDQRSRQAAGGRMDHHADGLIDDDQVFVLEKHAERNVLGLRFCLDRFGRRQQQQIAVTDLEFRLGDGFTIDCHGPRQYQVLDPGAGEGRQRAGEDGVEPVAGHAGIDRHLKFNVVAGNIVHERS